LTFAISLRRALQPTQRCFFALTGTNALGGFDESLADNAALFFDFLPIVVVVVAVTTSLSPKLARPMCVAISEKGIIKPAPKNEA